MWPFKSKGKIEPSTLIHGDLWKVKDVEDEVTWCLTQEWHKETWRPSPALIQKDGGSCSQYLGQKFDPEKSDLIEVGWDHDHCEICWWTLHEAEDEAQGVGYRNEGRSWLCTECFERFVRDDTMNLKTSSEQGGADQPTTAPRWDPE